jgi:hypothetical protein
MCYKNNNVSIINLFYSVVMRSWWVLNYVDLEGKYKSIFTSHQLTEISYRERERAACAV